jgi:hypothetical protein
MNRREAMALLTASAALPVARLYGEGQGRGSINAAHSNVFTPQQFGAVADGKALDSVSVNAAIDSCSRAGGGLVYCPPGQYLSGTVELKSNVTLYLEAGAVILGSTDVRQYASKPGPDPNADAGQRHLIFARDADNISIMGPGRIDGQGKAFWRPSNRRPVAPDDMWTDRRHFDWLTNARVSPLIELVNCTNVRLESIKIIGASGWTLRPINCTRLFIHGVTIRNPAIGPNTDGIDLTGCQQVAISDCLIDTGDDAICLKSENPYGSSPRTSRNITITNCILTSSTNGFKIGTATQGGFENITFANSTIVSSDSDLASRMIAGIAIEMVDGGWIDGLVISGIQIDDARAPLFIRRGNRSNLFPAQNAGLRGVLIDGVQARGAILTSSITGIPGMDVEDVHLNEIHIKTVMPGRREWLKASVPEVPAGYPESRMFGWLPAFGLYCRHVRGLTLREITFSAPKDEWRSAAVFDDVRELKLNGLATTQTTGGTAPLALINTRDVWVANAAAPANAKALVRIEGTRSDNLLFSSCDLRGAAALADIAGDVNANAVRAEYNITKNGPSA